MLPNVAPEVNPLHSDSTFHIFEERNLNKLNTGDIILCHSSGPNGSRDHGLDGIIEWATHSPWEHAGLIIRDPWWLSHKGLFIFQSGDGPNGYPDILNGNSKGVTLNKLDDFLRNRTYIFVRTLENFPFTESKKIQFQKTFEESHAKPYDRNLCSWLGTGCGSFFGCRCCSQISTPPTKKTFWCSALVAFIYVQMQLFDSKLDWSCQTPVDLYKSDVKSPYKLSPAWRLK